VSAVESGVSTGEGPAPRRLGASARVLLSSLALVAAKVATMGFGFLAWVVAARVYAPAEVGIASGVVAAVTLCAQFALIGVGSAVITLMPRYASAPGRLLDTSVSLLALSSLAAGLLFLLVAAVVLVELRVVSADPLFAAMFLFLAVAGTLGVLFDQASTARRRGDQVLVRGALAGIVTLAAVPLLATATASGAVSIFGAWALGGVVTLVFGLWMLGRAVPGYRARPRLEPPIARELVVVGLPNYVLTLAERAPGFVLPILVTELLSPADNAAWYAAWMMAWVVFIVPIQVGMTSFAEIARHPERTGSIVRQGVLTSLGLGVAGAIVLAVIAEFALGLLGSTYADAGVLPLRILLVGVVPMTLVQAWFSLARARQRLREAIIVGTAASVASIVLPAWAGLGGGLPAMALAWLAVQCVTAVIALVRLRSAAPVQPAAGAAA